MSREEATTNKFDSITNSIRTNDNKKRRLIRQDNSIEFYYKNVKSRQHSKSTSENEEADRKVDRISTTT